MKKNTLRLIVCAVAGFGSLVAQQTLTAATYTWANGAVGGNWWNTALWTKTGGGTGYPSAAGDVANLNIDFTAAISVGTDANAPTLGIFNWGDSTAPYYTSTIGYIGGGPVTFNNNGAVAQINYTSPGSTADAFKSDMILQDNLTINVPNSTTTITVYGTISQSGGSYSITKTGNGYLSLDPGNSASGSNSYTGLTTVSAGRLYVSNNGGRIAVAGNILIQGTARLQNFTSEAIADTANIDFQGGDWNMGTNSETIGSLTSASGVGSIFSGGMLTLAATSGTTSYGGTIGVGGTGALAFGKTGGSTQTLAGTAANAFTAVSVTGGILQLDKTPGVDALTGPITVGDGAGNGRIRLLAANQINDASTFTFNAGTLDTNGFSEKLSTLTNAGASTIDMGAGASILNFANSSGQSWSGSIQVLDWSGLPTGGGTDQVLFGTDATGLSAGQLAAISFVNPNPGIWVPGTYGAKILTSGEIVPVPEPAILGTVALSGLLALRRRRRVRA